MPSTSCPRCGRKYSIELQDLDRVLRCSRCECRFTAAGGELPAEEPTAENASPWSGEEPPIRGSGGRSRRGRGDFQAVIPGWHPNQLRHAKATGRSRGEAGLDAARPVAMTPICETGELRGSEHEPGQTPERLG